MGWVAAGRSGGQEHPEEGWEKDRVEAGGLGQAHELRVGDGPGGGEGDEAGLRGLVRREVGEGVRWGGGRAGIRGGVFGDGWLGRGLWWLQSPGGVRGD